MLPGADHCRNDASVAIDPTNSVAARIANVQVIVRVKRHTQRQIEPGLPAGAVIAAIAGFTDAGEIVQRALLKVDAPDAV